MRALFVIVAFVAAGNAFAQLLTEKKFFTLPQYTTVGGKPIKSVRVGYETYGKLNAAGDNAVFVPHFFSGTSHAAAATRPTTRLPATGTRSSARARRSTPTNISW